MKRTTRLFLILFLISIVGTATATELSEKLLRSEAFSDLQPLESTRFSEKYVLFVEQPLDHSRPETGSFRQRIVVCHAGFDRPTVIVTEGYGGSYALHPGYIDELAELFNTNIVFVEHRYFLESTPEPRNWDYLTAENSAHDLHRVTSAMKRIYPGKWISTGISKGGQTTLIYRSFFPDDVDLSVPYVAPVCRAVEDGRHEPFLRKVSTPENRRKIADFQTEILKRRATMRPLLDDYCRTQGLTFRISPDEVLDYCVLEYPFAFWQWGHAPERIPGNDADDRTLFDHLLRISEPSYFAENQPNVSFFVQAARELGYYGYDTKPLKKYLTIKNSRHYLRNILLPEGTTIRFDRRLHQKITGYLKKNDPKIIFVYGENDPWTAAGISEQRGKQNRIIAIQPGGSHKARIRTMPESIRTQICDRIASWLAE